MLSSKAQRHLTYTQLNKNKNLQDNSFIKNASKSNTSTVT